MTNSEADIHCEYNLNKTDIEPISTTTSALFAGVSHGVSIPLIPLGQVIDFPVDLFTQGLRGTRADINQYYL